MNDTVKEWQGKANRDLANACRELAAFPPSARLFPFSVK
jgi:hypothetical protein